MKRYTKGSSAKMAMEYKKNVPSAINKAFLRRRVDAAFISSAVAHKQNFVSLGIIAKREVLSVLVLPSQQTQDDSESATSNRLAKVLHVEGKVIIGDKALRYALAHDDYIDLAALWHEKTQLPFVFALLCYHKEKKHYTKIAKEFTKKEFKIPQYLLKKAAKQTAIPSQEILNYLKLISYKLDTKAYKGLRKFYKMKV